MVLMLIDTVIAVVVYLIIGLALCYLVSYTDFNTWFCKKIDDSPLSSIIIALFWPVYMVTVCAFLFWIYMESLVERIEKCAREQRRKRDGEKCR